jgi:hypothetical protein
MKVLPAQHDLKDAMQSGKCRSLGNPQPTPDGRVNPFQGDLELVKALRHLAQGQDSGQGCFTLARKPFAPLRTGFAQFLNGGFTQKGQQIGVQVLRCFGNIACCHRAPVDMNP